MPQPSQTAMSGAPYGFSKLLDDHSHPHPMLELTAKDDPEDASAVVFRRCPLHAVKKHTYSSLANGAARNVIHRDIIRKTFCWGTPSEDSRFWLVRVRAGLVPVRRCAFRSTIYRPRWYMVSRTQKLSIYVIWACWRTSCCAVRPRFW